jgi:proteic killer suppression protein
MIDSFADKSTQDIFDGKRVKWLPPELARIAQRKLQYINAAVVLSDLNVPPGNKLKPLKGRLRGFYSIRINDQFRVIFRWNDGRAEHVKVTDYH